VNANHLAVVLGLTSPWEVPRVGSLSLGIGGQPALEWQLQTSLCPSDTLSALKLQTSLALSALNLFGNKQTNYLGKPNKAQMITI